MAKRGGVSEANRAHAKNKGAFGWFCGGPSHRRSDQEVGHCEKTAVLGAKPAGDAALSSKGTLFTPHPGPGRCWAESGPPIGLKSWVPGPGP